MGFSGHLALPLLTVGLLRLVSSRRLLVGSRGFERPHASRLADFGAALPNGANISDVELDAIIQKLVEARDDEEANRCTISLEPVLVDNKVGPDGLVVVVEPPGEEARSGAEVRVNMYNVPSARRWYCVPNPVDPYINLPLRNTSRVLVLTELPGTLCPTLPGRPARRSTDVSYDFTVLKSLVEECDVLTVRALLDQVSDTVFSERDFFGRTVLDATNHLNCVRAAELLVARMDRASIGNQDDSGYTVLHKAASRGQHELAALFINHMDRATVNARVRVTVYGCETALAMAAWRGFVVTTGIILDATETDDLRIQDRYNRTALHYAVDFSTAFPLHRGCSPDWRATANAAHPCLFTEVGERVNKSAVVRMLLGRMGEDVVLLQDSDGWNALHTVVRWGKQELLDTFLSGMSARAIQAPGSNGRTALHLAAHYGHPDAFHSLLEAVPNDDFVIARCETGQTALHLAMVRQGGGLDEDENCEGQQRLVRELLDRMGRSVTLAQYIAARDNMGWTALHAACSLAYTWYGSTAGHTANVRLLLQRMDAEDVAAVDDLGCTALHIAARRGLSKLVQELLERMDKAAIRKKDIYGKTALHCAAELGHLPAVELIATHMDRAGLDAKDARGRTAEELARGMGHANAAALLGRALATIDES